MFRIVFVIVTSLLVNACYDFGNKTAESVFVDGEQFCSATDANKQLYRYMQDRYFWNDELTQDFSPDAYDSVKDAVVALRAPQDRFSFAVTEQEFQDNQLSRFIGFGFSSHINAEKDGLRLHIVFKESIAYQMGMRRGDTIVAIEGTPVSELIQQIEAGSLTWGDVFGPGEVGISKYVNVIKIDGTELTIEISKKEIIAETVLHHDIRDVEDTKVGYLVFNSFKDNSKFELESAFEDFNDANVEELVLDLRYNGGGLNDVANQLASQIAGDIVKNEIFMKMKFNEDNKADNQAFYFDLGPATQKLNLSRVFVLQTGSTCSASELVINSLKPYIEVITIGQTTCGKPIGMYPTPICKDVVYAINFQTLNAADFGDYFDGLPPQCSVQEQIVGDWDAEGDALYQAASHVMRTGQCPEPPAQNRNSHPVTPLKADWFEPEWQNSAQ